MRKALLIYFTLLIGVTGYTQTQDSLEFSIYLIGDAGEISDKDSTALDFLFRKLAKETENSAVIYLGDNVYPEGLSSVNSKNRKQEEQILDNQLARLNSYKGKAYVIPGNHDYAQGKVYGIENLTNQENYVNKLLGDSSFVPYNGCPDPVEIALSDKVTLVILNTEWMLYKHHDPEELNDCECKSTEETLLALQDILARNQNKHLLVAGHHPVYTHGSHGGYFTLKDHLFPLTLKIPKAYIPLPIVGSIYPLSRKMGISPQDISNPANNKMRKGFEKIFAVHPGLIYAAGHEHSLQYIKKDSIHYIVSGSGAKTTPVKKGKYSQFAESTTGFSKISFYSGGKTEIQYFNAKEQIFYSSHTTPGIINTSLEKHIASFPDSILIAASSKYNANKGKKKWFGENYRKEWATPIKVPVFNISEEKGGLKIIQKGGGMATLSFRLEDSLGNQYVLRSVDKNPDKAIPEELQLTIAKEVVQDQISAAHPYAALAVPTMSEAIGIYHTNPKIVYVMDDPRFGIYQNMAANTMFLFEERPSKNTGEIESFGNAKKIYSTTKVIEKLKEDNDNHIDYKFTLRSRLYDMVIGDWDRHDDQWRWAGFKEKKGKLYRPIPRDRDQVFFVNEGILPKIVSKRGIIPKFEGFNKDIKWEPGFNFNARYFDRDFLAQATKEDWLNEANFIQKNLTDEVIEKSVRQLPDSIFELNGKEIIQLIKSRRDNLTKIAGNYYHALSKIVTITCSDKSEKIVLTRKENGVTHLKINKISKKDNIKQVIYERTFFPEETSEIRIYAFGGEDEFTVEGTEKSSIKARIIGGSGEDIFIDKTTKKTFKNVLIYDTRDSTTYDKTGGALKYKLSNRAGINEYSRTSYKINTYMPLLYGGYTPDDGILIGGGVNMTIQQFRKYPYGMKHQLLAAASVLTGAFKLKYKGVLTDFIGRHDLELDVDMRAPKNSNFYGIGNNSTNSDGISNDEYRFRYTIHQVNPSLRFDLTKKIGFNLGLSYVYTNVNYKDDIEGKYFENSEADQNIEDPYAAQNYGGITASFEIDNRDNSRLPKSGIYFNVGTNFLNNFSDKDYNYINLNSELSFYKTVKIPRDLTFACKFEGTSNFNDYHYIMSNKLGGKDNLRGFRRDRFYGRSSFYNTLEARMDVYKVRNNILPFTVGLIAFHDIGRVWADNETSRIWHQNAGGGIYIIPIDIIALTATAAVSQENFSVYVDLGFSF